MTETALGYRTRDRPGPGLATIEEPDGRVMLWSLNLRKAHATPCAQCGALAGRNYRPPLPRGPGSPRLCRPCVEGTQEA